MKQNGSLCSVIAGNLAKVPLATQTCFLTEDKERWCCYNAAASALASNSNSPDLVFPSALPSASAGVIVVTQRTSIVPRERKLSDENRKSERISGLHSGVRTSSIFWPFIHPGSIFCFKKSTFSHSCAEHESRSQSWHPTRLSL